MAITPIDAKVVLRALTVSAALGATAFGVSHLITSSSSNSDAATARPATATFRKLLEPKHLHAAVDAETATPYPERRTLPPISDALRAKGYHECMMPDPGPGPYAPYKPIAMGGRLFAPKAGGHTDDFGYDVVLHLNGAEPVRKALVQTVRGVVFAGIDLGIGSGVYEDAFAQPQAFDYVRQSIEKALKAHAGDERAHIRHLALSAWSAGYGGVNAILRRHESEIDAVVLLDGLHAGFSQQNPRDRSPESLSVGYIMPTIAFAAKAAAGKKIFYYSHSHIDPGDYASTSLVGAHILQKLGLTTDPVANDADPFPVVAKVDFGGFHLRNHGGRDERAHCAHTRFIDEAVGDVLEPAWQTPLATTPTAPDVIATRAVRTTAARLAPTVAGSLAMLKAPAAAKVTPAAAVELNADTDALLTSVP